MRLLLLVFILSLVTCVVAQSGRVSPTDPAPLASPTTPEKSVKEMFDEANSYNRTKFKEFDQKKVPVSDSLIQQTQRERKQLAARYAAIVGKRTDLSSDELYYLGMLHWIADNLDGARETFSKYVVTEDIPAEKAQDARAILAVAYARQKQFPIAEKTLDRLFEKLAGPPQPTWPDRKGNSTRSVRRWRPRRSRRSRRRCVRGIQVDRRAISRHAKKGSTRSSTAGFFFLRSIVSSAAQEKADATASRHAFDGSQIPGLASLVRDCRPADHV